ncbi:hypothetical protein PV10_07418 [Exophiala mesophila]|uniref:Polyadenylation factor subunit 2 n=1 Tax=Exophiala mesophila TaxID=212818 RepID=A0A0D1XPP8_EXOME|nr:uncharacterized protein PV10_07418 [Exophiala mesophila]KIV90076.1 hypothetical protein PV10_07418 [Exophiala mesophila]
MATNYDDGGDAGAFRKRRPRPITDYGTSMVQWMSHRKPSYKGSWHYEQERPSLSYVVDILPPRARLDSPAESVPTRHLHTSLGKSKKPVTVVRWMPEGRRLLAGVHNGEFMLWNGMSFNFETVTVMGSSSLRAAEWSNRKDWLVAANDEGTVYYLQPTLNNPHRFKGHDAPIRDLAFAPSDTKFVTASDDNTLKIWDFVSSTNESTFKDHGWDVKACDWHPTKGLVVSGSKDHSVRLWDPRTTRNLTTLHGHKNAITATVFSRLRDQLLATSGRDGQTRIFDIRMMRDVAILRGHDKGVTTVSWHPIHSSLLSTGGDDGSLNTYLLTEPNTPTGVASTTISPYSTSDPRSAPPQSIYPAHRIPHAHESSIWSLDWHPLGHILASGSNDHYTRFWSRAEPGLTTCFKDQFHLGEEGAEAQGTWDRKFGKRQARELEEQEEMDEAEGLEDQAQQLQMQQLQFPQNGVPGLSIPGLPGLGQSLPGLNPGAPPPPMPFPSGSSSGLNGSAAPMPPIPPPHFPGFQQGIVPPPNYGQAGQHHYAHQPGLYPPPPPPPPPSHQHQHHPPPPLPFPPPAGLDQDALKRLISQAQAQAQAQAQPPLGFPSGFPPPPPPPPPGLGAGIPGLPVPGPGGDQTRRRAPLPSQQDGFKAEQARGNYRVAR